MAIGDFIKKKLTDAVSNAVAGGGKKEENPAVQQVVVQQVPGPEQFPNILTNALNTLSAGDGEGAKNLFTQALSINPQSALALAGRGASALIDLTSYRRFDAEDCERAGNEAITYWKNALSKPDFNDEATSLMGNSVIVFVRWAHKNSTKRYEDKKREAGATTNKESGRGLVSAAKNLVAEDLPFVEQRDMEEKALKKFVDDVLELNCMMSCIPLLEALRDDLSDAVSYDALVKAGAALFSNKHQYNRLFTPARAIIEGRSDWHGKCKVTQTSEQIKYSGAITVSDTAKKYKIKNIPVVFYTKGKKSFCFEIKKKQQVIVGSERAARIAEQCKSFSVWNVSAKKKKLLMVCSRLLRDDELAGQIEGIAGMIDAAVSEGSQICEMIMTSGGKLGFFAGLFAK
jgi:tetratricopeptide (TPR) repeat protein